MQSKLPDINAAIVRYRSKALDALERDQMETAAICFTAMNALLPDDYRIEINTIKFNELVKAKYTIICPSCNEEHLFGIIKPFDVILLDIERLITNNRTVKVWSCPTCNEQNDFLHSDRNTTQFEKPFFTRVAPEPPIKNGLNGRLGYASSFHKWFEVFVNELEHQIGLYRADYQSQQEEAGQPGFDDADVE